MDTHVLLVTEVAGVDSEIVDRVAVLVSLNDRLILGGIRFHTLDGYLVAAPSRRYQLPTYTPCPSFSSLGL